MSATPRRSRTPLAAMNRIAASLERLVEIGEFLVEELTVPKSARATVDQYERIRKAVHDRHIPLDTFNSMLRSYRVSRVGLLTKGEASDLISRLESTEPVKGGATATTPEGKEG